MGHHPPIGAQTVNIPSSGISPITGILIIIAIAIIVGVIYFIYKMRKS